MALKTGTLGDTPMMAERVARGKESQSTANGGIVPPPTSFVNITHPSSLDGRQRASLEALLNAGFLPKVYVYKSPDGEEIMAVTRMQRDTEKQYHPTTCQGRDKAGRALYSTTAIPAPRPIYNLDQLAVRTGAPVLVVEGEKTADAAARQFPDYVVTTCFGGSSGVGTADWRALAGRNVVIWPDNDKPGQTAKDKLVPVLLGMDCTLRIVALPEA